MDGGGNPREFLTMKNLSMENGGKVLFALLCMLLPFVTGCLGLHKAVGEGDLAKAGQFLQKGVDVDARDSYGRTPLMWATDDLGVVHYLVDKGADVNAKGKWGYTPLMWAALNGHLDVAACLLEHGADATVRDDRGATARMFATAGGHTNVVELLQRHGVAE